MSHPELARVVYVAIIARKGDWVVASKPRDLWLEVYEIVPFLGGKSSGYKRQIQDEGVYLLDFGQKKEAVIGPVRGS
jgi:hypothetical protein